ncbi:MAG TPA: AAA family ATPase [Gaiellaceae bacterium]|nr:AAA family ATPase [Gaiellaceae bacterium]
MGEPGPQTPPGVGGRTELLGREEEREQLAALVASVRAGRSGVLVLRGEPGIGKSALLEDAVEQAEPMLVLRAAGVGSETELPFSGLSKLLGPLTAKLDLLPQPQAAALSGALAMGPPAPGDPLTVAAATLTLLACGAERSGLIAVVDDAHWLDSSSLRALTFAARRLDAEGMGLLFAVREREASLLDEANLPELRVGPLPEESARQLLAQSCPDLAPGVFEIVLETAAGNPLALVEIPRSLSSEQASGEAPIVGPLRGGAGLERAYLQQLAGFSDSVRRALLVVATAEPDETEALAQALPRAGAAWADLETAEKAGLLSLGAEIRFRHPFLRSAVYHGASPKERRAVHHALADSLRDWGGSQRVAWHRALAQPTPNEEVAAAVAQAGDEALARNAPASAARAFELAAELTPESRLSARRLLASAQALVLSGAAPRARELLDRALVKAGDGELRLDIQQLRARTLVGGGAPFDAYAVLTAEAARIEEVDPGRAAILYAEAAYGADAAARPADALEAAERAHRLAEPIGGDPLKYAAISLSESLLLVGEIDRAYDVRPEGIEAFERANPLQSMQPGAAASFAAVAGYEEESHRHLTLVAAALRAVSAPGLLAFPLGALAHLQFRLGRWREAEASATEALELGQSAGMVGFNGFALSALAYVEAGQGRFLQARIHAEEALEIARGGTQVAFLYALPALVLEGLGSGDAVEASRHGENLVRLYQERGYCAPGVSCWQANVVEAYLRAGKRSEAEQLTTAFSAEATTSKHPWALAASARCRGMLSDADAFEGEFAGSLELHDRLPLPFERARTELALGEARRRLKRRADARDPLQRALATFEDLGATPWAARAREELQASGGRPTSRAHAPADELTSHELRVAQTVARGVTNRQAAAELFLSPKTVDFHLRNIYRKLGVHTRTELTLRLAQAGLVAQEGQPV